MLNSNKDPIINSNDGVVEHIPNYSNERENIYFGLTIVGVLVVAAYLLIITRNTETIVNRPPPVLQNTITQFQNAIDEISMMVEMNELQLPLSLDALRSLEIEPFLSNKITLVQAGCFVYTHEKHQLRVNYQTDKDWSIDWRLNDHDDLEHASENNKDFCRYTEHWLSASHASTTH